MKLAELNNEIELNEGLIGFISKLLKSTKTFKADISDKEKKKYVDDIMDKVLETIIKSIPKLRKWETPHELGDKLKKNYQTSVRETCNPILGNITQHLYKFPEKALTLDIKKVSAAVLGNALKQSTGQKEWTEASWLTMVASKLI